MTAHAMKGDRERCIAAGMDDHLAKPFDLGDLRRVVERWAEAAPGEGEPDDDLDAGVLARPPPLRGLTPPPKA
jgi:DNA-binding response OmpR family regulator